MNQLRQNLDLILTFLGLLMGLASLAILLYVIDAVLNGG